MKYSFAASLFGVAILAGCASGPTVPAGMKPGQFVDYTCDGNKRLQARLAADGSTVRVRHEGGYELDSKGNGVFEGEGWKLVTQGPGATMLVHNGKTVVNNCKPV